MPLPTSVPPAGHPGGDPVGGVPPVGPEPPELGPTAGPPGRVARRAGEGSLRNGRHAGGEPWAPPPLAPPFPPPPAPPAGDSLRAPADPGAGAAAAAGSAPAGERSLDPADWERFRALAHRALDDMVDYLAQVRERPAWQPMPAAAKARLTEAVPRQGTDLETVYEQFRRDVLPYPTGNIHPRFWGWVRGTGTPVGMLADLLAAGMNNHVAGSDQSASVVERQVIGWLAELLGLPPQTSGLLVSGATAANLVGLTVARFAKAGFAVREEGLQGDPARPRLTVYASCEVHSWAQKCSELMGLGNQALRRVPVDADYRIDQGALRELVAADRAAGCRPFCVVGTAGTVNTGAVDDLPALAAFCRREDLWFHVDGAFGALAGLSARLRPLVAGLAEADSVAFDLHKWGYLPYEVGCALVRDQTAHRAAFALTPHYLRSTERGLAVDSLAFADLGVQLSRGFRALKVWMSLKTQGADEWARVIEQNVAQVRRFAGQVRAHPRLELLAPVPLNVVCFRYLAAGWAPEALDWLNREIMLRVQERGVAVVSGTLLATPRGSRFALRVAHTNHRSRQEDFDLLLAAVLAEGEALEKGGVPVTAAMAAS